jgi:hypothetical protein
MALSQVKQVKLKKLVLESANGKKKIDIREIMREMVLYEDLFSPSLTAEIMVVTSVPIDDALPFTGQDFITIQFQSPDKGNVEAKLSLYKVSDRVQGAKRRQFVYFLKCASPEFCHNEKVRISKFYDDKQTEIVKKLYDAWVKDFSNKKKLVIHGESKDKDRILVPNWSPLHAINFVTNRCAKNDEPNSLPNFIFYEALKPGGNGSEFHYVSFGDLVKNKQPVKEYVHVEEKSLNGSENDDVASRNVRSFQVKSTADYLAEVSSGSLAGKTIIVDITKKRYDIHEYNYFDEFKATRGKIEKNPNLAEPTDKEKVVPSDSYISVLPKRRGLFTDKEPGEAVDEDKENSSRVEQTAWRRNMFMSRIENTKCILETSGDSNLRVGDMVTWDIPSNQPVLTQQKKNPYIKGKWLVVSVAHKINKDNGYTQTVEIVKDSVVRTYPKLSFFEVVSSVASFISAATSILGGGLLKVSTINIEEIFNRNR